MSQEQDQQFFDNFMIILGFLVLFMFAMMVLAGSLAGRVDPVDAAVEAQIKERIMPVGRVALIGEEPEAAEVAAVNAAAAAASELPLSGKEVYEQACLACHGAGVAGAPKFGDIDAWTARIGKGIDVLYDHAINGFQGEAGVMIAKGGRADLSDDEVKASVDYIVENSQ